VTWPSVSTTMMPTSEPAKNPASRASTRQSSCRPSGPESRLT
jgi:hypothetical protein